MRAPAVSNKSGLTPPIQSSVASPGSIEKSPAFLPNPESLLGLRLMAEQERGFGTLKIILEAAVGRARVCGGFAFFDTLRGNIRAW
ncbi:Paired amphipathic helix protein Sin3b [Methylocaldum marinum]|uniref:Paired amphipathic helix protein Sin3b n=1 Tax=Methylocaldum marinum TaxID=1432792 RepID=A0A250KUK1_9GAMM|nr:Paired amphipathic helix protein Sin3b [Methylocaldum marinum]